MFIKFTKDVEKEYLTEEERNIILKNFFTVKWQLETLSQDWYNKDEELWKESIEKSEKLPEYYFTRLPLYHLSKCPFCGTVLQHSFDPWGVNGLWWQHDENSVIYKKHKACEHFRLLKGAVNLNNNPPIGSNYSDSLIGPTKPYIIPRILRMESMIAVISSFQMTNGYIAYPIAYFSESKPPTGSLPASWTNIMREGYGHPDSPEYQEFNLTPWLEIGRIVWANQDDGDLILHHHPDKKCHYEGLAINGKEQRIFQAFHYQYTPIVDKDDALPSPETDKKNDEFNTIV